jgi:hypothetical protein
MTSRNTVFKLRSLRSLGLPEGISRKMNQADKPAPPNRIAASRYHSFKVVRVREYTDVI